MCLQELIWCICGHAELQPRQPCTRALALALTHPAPISTPSSALASRRTIFPSPPLDDHDNTNTNSNSDPSPIPTTIPNNNYNSDDNNGNQGVYPLSPTQICTTVLHGNHRNLAPRPCAYCRAHYASSTSAVPSTSAFPSSSVPSQPGIDLGSPCPRAGSTLDALITANAGREGQAFEAMREDVGFWMAGEEGWEPVGWRAVMGRGEGKEGVSGGDNGDGDGDAEMGNGGWDGGGGGGVGRG